MKDKTLFVRICKRIKENCMQEKHLLGGGVGDLEGDWLGLNVGLV